MSRSTNCEQVRETAVAGRYLAGRLSAEEEAAFEVHYLVCRRCQDEVRLAAAICGEMGADPVRRRPRRLWLGLGLAAAAGLAAVLVLRPSGVDPDMAALGAVQQPPIYLPVPLRAEPEPSDSVFEHAMRDYDAGRWPAAAAGLERALEAGADPVPAAFFLGASWLMADRPAEAAEAFRRVVAAAPNSYVPEARYYLAKALLRQGETGEAVGHLRRVDASAGRLAVRAAALADTVETRFRR